MFLLLILVGSIFEVIADIMLKKWSIEAKATFLGIGLVLYTIGTIFWAISLKYEYLSRAAIIFNLSNLLLALAAGVFIFNEELDTRSRVGIILGLVSIYLLES